MLKADHIQLRAGVGEELTANKAISQEFFCVGDDEKEACLFHLLDKMQDTDRSIVFTNTKRRWRKKMHQED